MIELIRLHQSKAGEASKVTTKLLTDLADVATLILAPGLLHGQAGVSAEAGGGQVRTETVAV